ncbi:MAG TPA: glucose 1-dehydrogenase [Actinomycetota bacterium]|jgi:threonine dehydrogenase-like Zn-dependent dehydrogenase|nr:glucose 1-dehydrogenase [Actinomycetota bacterium]
MRALTVRPLVAGSAELSEVPEPPEADGSILCETVAVGVDGTDNEIVEGAYGEAPEGRDRLILGHESLGRVREAPAGSGFSAGDLVVGVVRRPDPVPCENCAAGEWDMCRNGLYTERGIKGLDGFIAERFRIEPEFAVKADPGLGRLAVLTEPASVAAKAWEHIERIGSSRGVFEPRTALVTGAGPLGLLGAMLGLQRGLDVHVLDVVDTGPKTVLANKVGATYHAGSVDDIDLAFDVVVECTGVGPLMLHAIEHMAAGGVMCLTGISPSGRTAPALDTDALNKRMVLNNNVVFGSVNAALRHYEQGARALAKTDRSWLESLVTRWEPLDRWADALERREGDVKTVIKIAAA